MSNFLKFLIIHNPSGLLLFEQTFEELPGNSDPEILSGFLFALTNISKEVAQQDISFIQLDNLRIVYHTAPKWIMVLITRTKLHTNEAQNLLFNLQQQFQEKFGSIFGPDFRFNITPFRSFALIVEKTLELESKYVHFMEERSENLNDYLENASRQWQSIQNSITQQAKAGGQWVTNWKSQDLKSSTKNQIIDSLQHLAQTEGFDETKGDNKEKNSKNKWI